MCRSNLHLAALTKLLDPLCLRALALKSTIGPAFALRATACTFFARSAKKVEAAGVEFEKALATTITITPA
jgi:hypothetical protein